MRQDRTVQASIFDLFAQHEIGCELKKASAWLDEHPALIGLVAGDRAARSSGRGRAALCAAQAVPAAELRGTGLPSRGLRIVPGLRPAAVGMEPEEVGAAQDDRRDPSRDLGGDQSEPACERPAGEDRGWQRRAPRQHGHGGLMHEPSDSSLLWDAVRVMVRLLKQAQRWMGDLARAWRDHRRAAKKRWQAIEFTRGRPKRVPLYRALIRIVRTTLAYLRAVATRLTASMNPAVALWRAKVRHYEPLVESVIAQSERRVLHGEAVPAREKLVSLFETHADIIVKRRRNVRYGHKLNLTTGRSGLILDLVIEAGNPADSDRLMPMLERHIAAYGAAPGGGGWRFCQPQEPGSREGMRGARHGLSQEERPQHRRHGPQPLGLSQAAQLPGQD